MRYDERISIIVPVYKVENFLGECIDSIIEQTYKNLEIILVDDGSPDRCGEICDEYAEKDSRIRVLHKENGGLSDARNAGIEVCTGSYIMFVDSDDFISNEMVEKLYRAIAEAEADIAVCNVQMADMEGKPSWGTFGKENAIEKKSYTSDDLLQMNNHSMHWLYVVAWNKLFRRKVFDMIRFPKGRIHEDEYIFHQVLQNADKVVGVENNLYFYRIREESITGKERGRQAMAGKLDTAEAYYFRCMYLTERGMYDQVAEWERFLFYSFLLPCSIEKNIKKKDIAHVCKYDKRVVINLATRRKIGKKELLKRFCFYYFPVIYRKAYGL